jgi:hypothetical protein
MRRLACHPHRSINVPVRREFRPPVPTATPLHAVTNSLPRRCRRTEWQVSRSFRVGAGRCEGGTTAENGSLLALFLRTWRLGRLTSQAESRGNPRVFAAERRRSWRGLWVRTSQERTVDRPRHGEPALTLPVPLTAPQAPAQPAGYLTAAAISCVPIAFLFTVLPR